MKRKHVTSVAAMLFLLVLGVAGCSNSTQTSGTASEETTGEPAETEAQMDSQAAANSEVFPGVDATAASELAASMEEILANNQFGLVYDGAITENVEGDVNIRPVSYENQQGITIAANLYLPADYDENGSYAAVVVAHPNGGVKEQVSGLFAQRLSENGYITIAYDAAYQGASGGMPRQTDNPFSRLEDIRASIDYLIGVAGVDSNRIGALGICGGGGYTIETAKTDKRISAVATISMFNSGRVRRNGFQDSDVEEISDRLAQAAAARENYVESGEVDYTGSLSTTRVEFTQEQLEQMPAGLYRDGAEYYGSTHFHPNSQSRYTIMSLMDLMAFDAEEQAELIDQPLLMMVGDISDTRYMTEAVFEKATETDDKELFLIPGAQHIDTYWKEEFVQQEMDKLTEFFGTRISVD